MNPQNLGILWVTNKNSWMTTQLFERVMLDIEVGLAKLGKRKVLLPVDNFLGRQIPMIGSRLQITQSKFCHPPPLAYINPWTQE